MSRCTEPLLWFCSSCSHPFEMGEWEQHDRSCPVCHSSTGVWRCGKCSGEFGQPSLGSEHPCLAKPSTAHRATRLVSRSPLKPRSTLTNTPVANPSQYTGSRSYLNPEAINLPHQPVPKARPRGVLKFFFVYGRASRLEFWCTTISIPFLLLIYLCLLVSLKDLINMNLLLILFFLGQVIALWLFTTVFVRRVHDSGCSVKTSRRDLGLIFISIPFLLMVFIRTFLSLGFQMNSTIPLVYLVGLPIIYWICLTIFVRRTPDSASSSTLILNAFNNIRLQCKRGDSDPNSYGPAIT